MNFLHGFMFTAWMLIGAASIAYGVANCSLFFVVLGVVACVFWLECWRAIR